MEFYCDNQAFQRSGAKGRSRAQRLNDLLRELFVLMIEFGFVISWLWISTHDNVNADHLSRGREADFLRTVYETGFWAVDTVVRRLPDAGRVRRLPEKRGEIPRTVGAQPAVSPGLEAYAPTTATAAAEPPAGDTTGNYFPRTLEVSSN